MGTEWVLVLLLKVGEFEMSTVPGFVSEKRCQEAGEQWKVQANKFRRDLGRAISVPGAAEASPAGCGSCVTSRCALWPQRRHSTKMVAAPRAMREGYCARAPPQQARPADTV